MKGPILPDYTGQEYDGTAHSRELEENDRENAALNAELEQAEAVSQVDGDLVPRWVVKALYVNTRETEEGRGYATGEESEASTQALRWVEQNHPWVPK